LEASKILILWRGKSKLKAYKMRFLRTTLQYRKREGKRGGRGRNQAREEVNIITLMLQETITGRNG
jgi:hypothetical protein